MEGPMRYIRVPILAATLAFALIASTGAALAQDGPPKYMLKAAIPIEPWFNLTTISLDISWVNPEGTQYAFGDRSAGAIEVFDAVNHTFIESAGKGSFVGVAPTGFAGPNGV